MSLFFVSFFFTHTILVLMGDPGTDKLREKLQHLVKNIGLAAIKSGTEAEDMSFNEIALVSEIARGITKHYVKIGGPEARNDIRELLKIGVDGIIAPMVESPYALALFVETIDELVDEPTRAQISPGINLETLQGFANLQSILQAPEFAKIHRVTAARSDLARSLRLDPDNERVTAIAREIVSYSQKKGASTSLGGSVRTDNIRQIMKEIAPDTINTRHMVLHADSILSNPESALVEALHFELDLYREMERRSSGTKSYRDRIETLESRMARVS